MPLGSYSPHFQSENFLLEKTPIKQSLQRNWDFDQHAIRAEYMRYSAGFLFGCQVSINHMFD